MKPFPSSVQAHFEMLVRAHRAAQRKSNLNVGWIKSVDERVETFIGYALNEPEGSIIGTVAGDQLRKMVYS
jgi:hypothetical protein